MDTPAKYFEFDFGVRSEAGQSVEEALQNTRGATRERPRRRPNVEVLEKRAPPRALQRGRKFLGSREVFHAGGVRSNAPGAFK